MALAAALRGLTRSDLFVTAMSSMDQTRRWQWGVYPLLSALSWCTLFSPLALASPAIHASLERPMVGWLMPGLSVVNRYPKP